MKRIALFIVLCSLGTAVAQDRQLQEDRLLRHNPSQPVEQRRLALVIGNGAYQHDKSLKNPANDASSLAKKRSRKRRPEISL